jgi:hypothetical protein
VKSALAGPPPLAPLANLDPTSIHAGIRERRWVGGRLASSGERHCGRAGASELRRTKAGPPGRRGPQADEAVDGRSATDGEGQSSHGGGKQEAAAETRRKNWWGLQGNMVISPVYLTPSAQDIDGMVCG